MPAPDRPKAKEQVLQLAFEGRWSHAEMAERVGVSTRTVERWTADPDFQARLTDLRANLARSLAEVAYADKGARIIALSQMAEDARRQFEARPLLKEIRPTADGEIVNEAFNRDAHAAFRDSLNDIAKELGERTNGATVTAGQITVIGIPQDVLEAMKG